MGCYSFCHYELPRQIDGTWNIVYDQWTWFFDKNVFAQNVVYNGMGFNSPSHPLIIAVAAVGEGPGKYTWGLDNGLCSQETEVMEWDTEDCCELDMSSVVVDYSSTNYTYNFQFDVDLPNCPDAIFDVDVMDGTTYIAGATIQNPAMLTNGINTVVGYFDVINIVPGPQRIEQSKKKPTKVVIYYCEKL